MKNVIHVKNLTKQFKVYKKKPGLKGSLVGLFKREHKLVTAVDNISFDIGQGELVGFIGPNGAGKTTTLKMLSGLLYPTSGELSVMGYTPFQRKSDYLKNISLVMGQKNQLWWDLPAIESFNLNKEIYEVPNEKYKSILDELVDMLGIEHVLNQQVRKLSLGERMKCELVASLLYTPQVLFLDEPTIGLDVVMQKRIRQFIKDYNKKYNATVILTSHYMDDVKEICDRVLIINQGKLIFDGSIDSLIHKYADYKILKVIVNKSFTNSEIAKYGEVKSTNNDSFIITVKRRDTSKIASEILKNFDVDDLDINEPRMEDIVSDIFQAVQ